MQALTADAPDALPAIGAASDHRAGAAIAFGTAFLGAGKPPHFAQVFEQRRLRRQAGHGNFVAVERSGWRQASGRAKVLIAGVDSGLPARVTPGSR